MQVKKQQIELDMEPWTWFQIGKGVHQGCILSLCLFDLYAENIMRNAGLDEAQAGIRIARRNINNLRYVNDTTLMAESKEELKSFLMKVKEESEKVGLTVNIQKTKIMASSAITSWQIVGETMETVAEFIFWAPKSLKMVTAAMKFKRHLLLERKLITNLRSVQFSSVAQLCLTLCDLMNRSTPGFPVHHQLPEFIRTHVHQVSDAIQPSHHRSSPSPPAPNPSQHHSFFQCVNSLHEVTKVPEFQL